MSPIATAATVFACVFGGALLGMALRTLLPAHHLGAESRDHVKLGMGLIVTMSALLLGMLVASAKSAYEDQKSELTQLTAKLVFLDRVLAHYGPDAQVAREGLRTATARAMEQIWPKDRTDARQLSPIAAGADVLYNQIQELSPKDESQRVLKAQASAIAIELGQTRWLMFEQRGSSVSTALLIIVVFWLTVIFISFGLYAPVNATVTATLMICAISVSCAIFLILEMDRPFEGMLQISKAPLQDALSHLGQ
jgi:hypothetical protein